MVGLRGLIPLLVALLISVHVDQLLILVDDDDLLVVPQGAAVAQHADHQQDLVHCITHKDDEQNEVKIRPVYSRAVGEAILEASVEITAKLVPA